MLGLVGVEKRSVSAKLDLFAQGEEFSIWGGLGRGDCVGRLDADHFFCLWNFRFVSEVLLRTTRTSIHMCHLFGWKFPMIYIKEKSYSYL